MVFGLAILFPASIWFSLTGSGVAATDRHILMVALVPVMATEAGADLSKMCPRACSNYAAQMKERRSRHGSGSILS
jgi:hypothetical protein